MKSLFENPFDFQSKTAMQFFWDQLLRLVRCYDAQHLWRKPWVLVKHLVNIYPWMRVMEGQGPRVTIVLSPWLFLHWCELTAVHLMELGVRSKSPKSSMSTKSSTASIVSIVLEIFLYLSELSELADLGRWAWELSILNDEKMGFAADVSWWFERARQSSSWVLFDKGFMMVGCWCDMMRNDVLVCWAFLTKLWWLSFFMRSLREELIVLTWLVWQCTYLWWWIQSKNQKKETRPVKSRKDAQKIAVTK